MRKFLIAILIFFNLSLFAEDNLIINGGFERELQTGQVMWNTTAYIYTEEAVRFFTTNEFSYEGKNSFAIVNFEPNDSKIIQWVEVEPNREYKLSCHVMVQRINQEFIGAHISLLSDLAKYKEVRSAENWHLLELFFKTGENQKEIAVVLGLGYHGNLNTGAAFFDSVKLETIGAGSSWLNPFSPSSSEFDFFPLMIGLIVLAGICGIVFFIVHIVKYFKSRKKVSKKVFLLPDPDEYSGYNDSGGALNRKAYIKKPMENGGFRESEFIIRDLSEAGFFILAEDLGIYEINDELLIEIIDGKRRLDLGRASVVRKEKEFDESGKVISRGYGLKFSEFNNRFKSTIRRLIKLPMR